MKGISHILAGAATGYAVSQTLGFDPVKTIGISIVAGLIVDLDAETSTINKMLFPLKGHLKDLLKIVVGCVLLLMPMFVLKYIGIIILISAVGSKLSEIFNICHRGILHDPIVGSILFLLPLHLLSLDKYYCIPFICGLVSHYILDSFTEYGLPLFLIGKQIRMPIHFQTGNYVVECLLLFLFIGFAIFIVPNFIVEVINNSSIAINNLDRFTNKVMGT